MPKLTTAQKNKDSIAARERFIKQMVEIWGKVKPNTPNPTSPGEEEIAKLVDLCTTTRGNRFRFISGPRKSSTNEGGVLFERLRWYRVIPGGSGNLGSLFMSQMRVDDSTFHKIDTFALLIGMCQGRVSWTDEWATLLNLGASK